MAKGLFDLLSGLGKTDAAAPADTEADTGRKLDIGSLLGGARDDLMEPVIGKEGIKGARMAALLQAGAAMLAASGYSRTPVSGGQALAAGLQAAQQGYGQSLNSALESAQGIQKLKQGQLAMRRQQILQQAAQGILGGGGAPAPDGAPAPAQELPMGAQQAGMPAPAAGAVAAGAPGGGPAPSMDGTAAGMPPPAAAAVAGSPQTPGFGKREAMAMTLLDPEHAAAYENLYQMSNPELKQLADGTIVNMRDPSLAGQSRPALDPGMVRDASGNVQLAPGYAQARSQLDMQKAFADKSQDLVDVVIPGQGTMRVPRAALGVGLTMGANGQPVATLGGPNGFMSAEDPARLKEREGNVATFLKAREEASNASQQAGQELMSLDNVAQLLKQAKPGLGQTARYHLGRVLAQTGLADKDQSKWVDAAAAFQSAQKTQALSVLKSTFGGNPTEGERAILLDSLGNLDAPQEAVQMRLDVQRVAAGRKQAYADFLQNYDGDRAKFEQSWRRSEEGSKKLFDYPEMWKHLPVQRGKAGTPAAGKTFVVTPDKHIFPVQVGPDGVPRPIGE